MPMPIAQKQRSTVSASIACLAEELQYLETKAAPGSLHLIHDVYCSRSFNSINNYYNHVHASFLLLLMSCEKYNGELKRQNL